jgi:hypothetical protein
MSISTDATDTLAVTEAGVYDLPADVYHADPVPGGSLSSSGVRRLLPPSCPAKFRWAADNPPETKPEWDLGHVAHKLVLGTGPEIVVVEADDWRTRAAKEKAAEARAAGAVPLLRADWERCDAMAVALATHPVASALFDPDWGEPERSLFWVDPETDVWRRAMLDWLPEWDGRNRVALPDYKTARSATRRDIAKAVYDYGYHIQLAYYLDGAQALGLAGDDAAVLLIVQEKTPPYLVNVVQPDDVALSIARDRIRQAIDTYAECRATGQWPGYGSEVELVSLPYWAVRDHYETHWETW